MVGAEKTEASSSMLQDFVIFDGASQISSSKVSILQPLTWLKIYYLPIVLVAFFLLADWASWLNLFI